MEGLYEREGSAPLQHLQSALTDEKKKAGAHASGDSLAGVVWTPSMRRMYTLLDRCLNNSSPQSLNASTDLVPHLLSAQRESAFISHHKEMIQRQIVQVNCRHSAAWTGHLCC